MDISSCIFNIITHFHSPGIRLCLGICSAYGKFVVELFLEPFTASFRCPTLNKSIGNDVKFLNCHLSTKFFHYKKSLHPLQEGKGINFLASLQLC
ncbi:putative sucrose synthase [Medicago truncatula]|uniref:Sucrose synthase n=1 Tax=Medicago truncatula TaxID=3880 RepID=A2Q6B7_MEDTR|nr:hypothetical protein MtrDRAFT_AC174467g10v1 [Medicago truncatula]AES78152.1 sucrose synthase [Medicago truncatula]RHN44816.1 putative sucrose synthase [Medicago truncatula]